MRPISKRMLCCSASLQTVKSKTADRKIVWNDPVNLSRVYISMTKASSDGSEGKQPADTMTLIYDCYNSLPKGLTFSLGSKVTFNQQEFFINSITPCYADGLHHYEIGLK